MGLFTIAAFIYFLDYLKNPSKKLYALHSLSGIFALFCKETSLFLILIFLLYGYLFSVQRRLLIRFVPAWALRLSCWMAMKSIAFAYPIPLKADTLLEALNRAWPVRS
ncbi:MAG: hypothetical protein QF619_04530 [Candidatus Binatia bacterium]|jgi:hypothetical protein|nr:hypothetical protein [Candidatus Binatia bacterium]|tara:strand:+ start:398 stop:721 length:324 start_codon:yes stop_codon:yes gene_type:complete